MNISAAQQPYTHFAGRKSQIDQTIENLEAQWGGSRMFVDPQKTEAKFKELMQSYNVSKLQVKKAYAQVLQENLMTMYPHTQDTLLTHLENEIKRQKGKS